LWDQGKPKSKGRLNYRKGGVQGRWWEKKRETGKKTGGESGGQKRPGEGRMEGAQFKETGEVTK